MAQWVKPLAQWPGFGALEPTWSWRWQCPFVTQVLPCWDWRQGQETLLDPGQHTANSKTLCLKAESKAQSLRRGAGGASLWELVRQKVGEMHTLALRDDNRHHFSSQPLLIHYICRYIHIYLSVFFGKKIPNYLRGEKIEKNFPVYFYTQHRNHPVTAEAA